MLTCQTHQHKYVYQRYLGNQLINMHGLYTPNKLPTHLVLQVPSILPLYFISAFCALSKTFNQFTYYLLSIVSQRTPNQKNIFYQLTMEQKDDNSTDIEMQQKLSKDNDSSPNRNASGESSATDDNPPVPPKRDYAAENAETQAPPEYASVKKRKKLISFPPRPEFVYKPERTAASMTCLQSCMIVVHLLIWLLGAIITGLGIWLKVDKDFWNIQQELDIKQFGISTTILIVVGVVIMIIGFCGCWGAIASKIWMLVVFSVVMIIIIILEIAAVALVWSSVASESMQEDVKLKAKNALRHIADDDNKRYFIDLIQRKLQCCGVDGPKDYSLDPKYANPIPGSCTPKDSATPYEKGCYAAIIEFLKSKAALVGGVAVAVLLLQLGVLVFTVCLICSIKNSAGNLIF